MIQINDFYNCRICVSDKMKQCKGLVLKNFGEQKTNTHTDSIISFSDDLLGSQNIIDFYEMKPDQL